MKKVFIIPALAFAFTTACVPAKKFKELEDRFAELEKKNENLRNDLSDCEDFNTSQTAELGTLEKELQQVKEEKNQLQKEYDQLTGAHNNLQDSYNALEKNSSSALAENSRQNRELLAQLEEKEKALAKEQARLDKLQKDLEARSNRIDELEGMIAAKDAKMQALKNSISKALTDFEGKGLTVEQRNGKVYVSMENKLLFSSGSWAVGSQGRPAVKQLGTVLAQNPDINVLIEGHTDNDPYGGNGPLQDNWDLSTKRATAIVHILQENSSIDPNRLTAAGRGEFVPVASNETTEGKAKNRRIEVILTPKLDEISELLNDM
ncbi:OmpA family protein [Mesonia oceanica]|uniref:Lipoprotein YiaD n=1 Tax=Mesonia oceanica TaxID=2687242 RepID=A0AC61Y3Z8_9FLAO|nr:OmpA family protein [Mesonia oceanica]MAQ41718.1 cell envelope biogenesis protein OmpA [Mesonia sp.]MBJ96542.1 cell envelope biogenesis protein OmpA [Flavobacteriaceae bacterium]VVU99132.1 putative lipoprotein YiaD [Mesonia oceanica]|tara:strand:- start:563 stop:1522 length:960 start_codon:yes stop_codon:yes gene_type:complete